MTHAVHLSDDLLIRSIDADLSVDQRLYAEHHLATCQSCRQRRQEWAESLDLVETGVASAVPPVPANSRKRLVAALHGQPASAEVGPVIGIEQGAAKPAGARAAWWQLAIAASVACAILAGLALRPQHPVVTQPAADSTNVSDSDYLPLPYSSATLSAAEAQVVRVEMPVSALREAGIFVASSDEEYVDADILLGLDGQPQGIRVVNDNTGVLN